MLRLGLCSARNATTIGCKRLSKKCSELLFNKLTEKMKSHVVRTLTSKAVGLAYERYEPNSDGTPLLVIHGLFGSKRNWETFCRTYNEMTGREVG